MSSYCYWSVGDGKYGKMLAAAVHSARHVGVKENFHIWSDMRVPGAITHDCGSFNKEHYLFKFDFLKNKVHDLMYDYYVFFDADSYFVRNPGDMTRHCGRDPVHVFLESDCDNPNNIREDWWGCPLPEYCDLMRQKGVKSKVVYNCNAGLWIIHRDAVDHVHRLGYEFWNYAKEKGHTFTEEAPLAYVGHMMVGNPYKHLQKNHTDVWASDWMGHFADRLPTDEEWDFVDYMTNEPYKVNPALVHCMRSKDKLEQLGNGLI